EGVWNASVQATSATTVWVLITAQYGAVESVPSAAFVSADAGKTWSAGLSGAGRVSTLPSASMLGLQAGPFTAIGNSAFFLSINMAPSGNLLIMAATSDKGVSWSQVNIGTDGAGSIPHFMTAPLAIAASSPSTLWIAGSISGHGTLIKSVNAGIMWREVPLSPPSASSLKPASWTAAALLSSFGQWINTLEPAGLMGQPLPGSPTAVTIEVRHDGTHPGASFAPFPAPCCIQPGQSTVRPAVNVSGANWVLPDLLSPWAQFPNAAWMVGPGGWGDNVAFLPFLSQPGHLLFVLMPPPMGTTVNGLTDLTTGQSVPIAYGTKPGQDTGYRTWIVQTGQWYRLSETVTATQPSTAGFTDFRVINPAS
ncbi:MAG: beta propeller repeat protein, partial [Sulfobacillus sp.]